MKRLILTSLAFVSTLAAAVEPLELKLWPEGAPGKMLPHSKFTEDFIRTKAGKSAITDISDPTITVFRPEKPNGTSIIVAPGGAYIFLSAIHEGTQVCEWLSSIGVTGILLKYRTPTRDESAPHEKPVADAAKAISIVREHAKEWQLDPNRVGLLGFSAGGNLLAHIACDRPAAPALPNFGVMIYGGGFLDSKEPTKLKEGFSVPADVPPMFIACAHDDGPNPIASTLLYLEYKKHGIPAELHLFTKGGHGFGMRDNKQPINAWPQRCAEWMGAMGWMPTKEKLQSRINEHQKALDLIVAMLKSEPWICGNDAMVLISETKDIEGKLAAAEKARNSALVDALRAKLQVCKEKQVVLDQQLKTSKSLKPEALVEEINAHKRAIAELQAERDKLINFDGGNSER